MVGLPYGDAQNTRSTQFFITFNDSKHLGDAPWEVAFGYIEPSSMESTADHLYAGYGEMEVRAHVRVPAIGDMPVTSAWMLDCD